MFRSGADQIAFSTSGLTRAFIDSAGLDIRSGGLRLRGGTRSDAPEGTYLNFTQTGAGTDTTNWKKVADVTIGTGLYKALALHIRVKSQYGNFGNSTRVTFGEFMAAFYRSSNVQDNINNASLVGYPMESHELRIIKTATGVYEVQIKQKANYRDAIVEMQVLSTNGGVITVPTTTANGSTTGTVYSAVNPDTTGNTQTHTFGDVQLGTVKAQNGAASGPSYTFGDDTNTGMYRYAADSLGFATGGVFRALLNSMGFSVNGSEIEVNGSTNNWKYLRFANSTTPKWDIATKDNDLSGALQFRPSAGSANRTYMSTGGDWTFGGNLYASNGTNAKPAFSFDGESNTGMYKYGTNQIGFTAGGSLIAYIQSGATYGLVVQSKISATGGNSDNWNAAHGWGNHASAGYLTAEADTLATVTGRGTSTTANLSTGSLSITTAAVPLSFTESGHSGNGQYWRMPLDGGNLRFDVSLTGGAGFSTYDNILQLNSDGTIDVQSSQMFDSSGNINTTKTITSGAITTSDNLKISAAKKLYFDGGTHTYIEEVSSDVLRIVVGGDEFMRFAEGASNLITMVDPVLIDSDNNVQNVLKVRADGTTSNANFYGVTFDFNMSGTESHTVDNYKYGLYIDFDSSDSGGDTTNETRLFPLYVDARNNAGGTADRLDAAYFYARSDGASTLTVLRGSFNYAFNNQTAGTVTQVMGSTSYGYDDTSGSGSCGTVWGAYNAAYGSGQGTGTLGALVGAQNLAAIDATNTKNVSSMYGSWNEVQLDNSSNAHTVSNAYVVYSVYDENDSDDSHTVNNGYLFFGDYQGTKPTNAFGVYIADDVESRFLGRVRAKEFDVGGVVVIDDARNATLGTTTTGALTATNITATSLSLSGAFTPTSIAATSTVSGSQFRASYGSVSAPAFTFKNDDDTGMWGASGSVKFAVNGSNRMTIGATATTVSGRISVVGDLQAGSVPQTIITSARALQNVTSITSTGQITASGLITASQTQQGFRHIAPDVMSGHTSRNEMTTSFTADETRWYMVPKVDGSNNFGREFSFNYSTEEWSIEGPFTSDGNFTVGGSLSFTNNPAIIQNAEDDLGQILIQVKNSSSTLRGVRWDAANASGGALRPDATNTSNLGLTNRVWNTLYINNIRMGTSNTLFADANRNITAGTVASGNITMTGTEFRFVSSVDSNLGMLLRDETYVSDEMDITATRLGSGNQPTLGLAGQSGINFYVGGSTALTLDTSQNATFENNLTVNGLAQFTNTDSNGRGIYRNNTAYDLRIGGGTSSDNGAFISVSGDTRGGANSTYNGRLEYHTGGDAFANQAAILGDHVWYASHAGGSASLMSLDSATGDLTIHQGDIRIPVARNMYFGASDHTYIGEDTNDRLRFFTGGTEMMRFTTGLLTLCSSIRKLNGHSLTM